MRFTTIISGVIMSGVAGVSLACDLPKLVVIPPKDQVAGKEAEVRAATIAYFEAMTAYTTCIQAELAGASSDLAKRVLVSRNNTAVAEAEFMMKLYNETVSPFAALSGALPGAPAVPAAPAPAN